MSGGLFVPSGARVPLLGLPPIDRPIRLDDGRAIRFDTLHRLPAGPRGEIVQMQMWRGPSGLQVGISLDPTDAWGPLLHASVSYQDVKHRPSWEDLTALKDALFGDVDVAMIMPSRADYVNFRDNCFHLWQLPQKWGMR